MYHDDYNDNDDDDDGDCATTIMTPTRLYLYTHEARDTHERETRTYTRACASPETGRGKNGKNEKRKKAAEPQSETPTSCGKNGHGAIMFLLGFISKRVINYTSKYNDDDEGYDDITYYWIYIHTYSICIYTIYRNYI